jgi:energy-coupling factor transporter ATP-binding protein EcfA2
MEPGPRTSMQLARLARVWEQGEHIFVSGPTKSGKTTLARRIVDIRVKRGGHTVVFCMKPLTDPTIVNEYKPADGWQRWEKWKRRTTSNDRQILLWPDVSKAKGNRAAILDIQKEVFQQAIDSINSVGHWTVQVDEGLYMTDPSFLGMAGDLAMGQSIGRSGNLSYVTLTQRPSHLPLILYGSAAHAFIGRTREQADLRRLSEMGPKEGSRALAGRITQLARHEFLWVPVAPDWDSEVVDMKA